MSPVVCLTGATGFLGAQIARRLLAYPDLTIVALVRATDAASAERRLSRAWRYRAGPGGAKVEAVACNVCLPNLGIDQAGYADLTQRITHVIHAAADMRVAGSLDESRRTNAHGTAHVLALARAAHLDHGLQRFAHISTAYVAGGRIGAIPEDALSEEFGFLNIYERSKYEGERLVQAARVALPISIFRPGMVVGDSRTGAIKTFNTIYVPLRHYLSGRLPVLPADPALRLNIVPVDYVADAIVRLTFEPAAEGLTFHLTAPPDTLPTAGELVDFTRRWAAKRLGLRLRKPLFIPLTIPATGDRFLRQRILRGSAHGRLTKLAVLLPYLHERREFRRENTDRLLGPYQLQWREFLSPLLEYAVAKGFMHDSERTVHEQVLFRLSRPSRRITYHDLAAGKKITRDSTQIRCEMLAAANALHSLGVRPGDRVALVGLNSTRYLTVDVAIGLVGAVSVPLYYTSPPADLDAILTASGAKLLLVGAPKLLQRLDELQAALPVVSFCSETVPANLSRSVMTWDEFLARGSTGEAGAPAPVDFDAPATLRYTSGTTGSPKGSSSITSTCGGWRNAWPPCCPGRPEFAPPRTCRFYR